MREVSSRIMLLGLALAFPVSSLAQTPAPTLAATMEMYVFPSSGQDSSQQSKDESECYNWAVSNVGTDPFALEKQTQADAQQAQANQQAAAQAGTGSGARGAVRGAAAGALIGEIANDDASEGAAWGAAAGAVRGRRQGRAAQQQAQEQVAEQAQQQEATTAQQLANFKNAFSVCLEAKEYMVKY